MQKAKDFGPIYSQVLNLLPPYSQQPPWQDVPVPDDIRRPPEDPMGVTADLLSTHTQAELVEASVLTIDSTDGVQLNPALCQAGTAIIALRKSKKYDPFELLAGGVALTGRRPPVCASLRDGRILRMIKRAAENVLIVSSSSVEVALFLSLGFPATFDTGLAQLGGHDLERVRKDFKLDPPKPKPRTGSIEEDSDEQGQEEPPPDILCLAWSPASLSVEPPANLADIVSHVGAMKQHLGLCTDRFCCWEPGREGIERIAFARNFGTLQHVKRAINESLTASSGAMIASPPSPEQRPQDLAQAIQYLERLRANPSRDYGDERRAWEKVQAFVKTDSIEPLFAAMNATEDPIERAYWLMAGMNASSLYPQHARMMLKMSAPAVADNPDKLVAYPDAQFRQLMQATEYQRKIFNDIIKYRKDPFRRWK